jgi:hypothetical protein
MREACPKFTQRGGPVHEMAVIGTLQHDMVESQLDDDRLPDYRAQAVAECIRFGEERAKQYPGCRVIKEDYLPIDDELLAATEMVEFTITDPDTGLECPGYRQEVYWYRGTTAGYLDFGIISANETEGEIIDYKFGNNAVEEASNNAQGIGYALGLRKKFPKLKKITVIFIMPHLDYVTQHTFTVPDFGMMYLRVVTIVRRAIEAHKRPDDFSMATPNTSSCLFCGLVGKCPKVTEIALKVGKKYRPLQVPDSVTPSLMLDPNDVAKGIKLAAIIAEWADAFKRQATAKTVDHPDFIPDGYILVQTQKRVIKNAKALGELAKKTLSRLAPTVEKYAELETSVEACYDVALGKLEKLISTAAPRGTKEAEVDEFGVSALNSGAVELGEPFAFLRQSRKQEGDKKTTEKA